MQRCLREVQGSLEEVVGLAAIKQVSVSAGRHWVLSRQVARPS